MGGALRLAGAGGQISGLDDGHGCEVVFGSRNSGPIAAQNVDQLMGLTIVRLLQTITITANPQSGLGGGLQSDRARVKLQAAL